MIDKNNSKNIFQEDGPKHHGLSLALIRDILVVITFSLIIWKLLNAQITANFKEFGFQDLLSLILALFTMWLSAMFYFKATEASNRFYNDTYKFTRDTSVMLGEMRERFSERLRRIDEGYAGLSKKIEAIYTTGFKPSGEEAISKKIHEEQAALQKKEREHRKIIDDLFDKTNISVEEKKGLQELLKQNEDDMSRLRKEIDANERKRTEEKSFTHERIGQYTSAKVVPKLLETALSDEEIMYVWRSIREQLNPEYLRDLKNADFIDEANDLSGKGIVYFRLKSKNQ